jgi:sodium transport system permease protein
MRLWEIWILYRRELRAAFRERTIVFNSVVIPIVLYPFLMWAIFTGMSFVRGQEERFESRVMFAGLPAAHHALRDTVEQVKRVRVVPDTMSVPQAKAAISSGDLDVLLSFVAAEVEAAELTENFTATLFYNESREQSDIAYHRTAGALRRYRTAWLAEEAAALGISDTAWEIYNLRAENTASGKEMGSFILGLMLPLFFVIMVAVGCFHPAVDATAGERERSTWETLMSVSASRLSIVLSKYLYVATVGCVAGLLNLTAMAVSMSTIMRPLVTRSGADFSFSVPASSLPVLVLGALLLAGFIAAGMMLFAAFARTFKEGQSMITPFYLLIIMPAALLNQPDMEFSTVMAVIPVVNLVMMVRHAIMGSFQLVQGILTLGVSVVAIGLCMIAARHVLQYEDVVMGSYSGSFTTFFKERLLKRRK